jgi:hypothetical protein
MQAQIWRWFPAHLTGFLKRHSRFEQKPLALPVEGKKPVKSFLFKAPALPWNFVNPDRFNKISAGVFFKKWD